MKQNLADKRKARAQSSNLLAATMYLDVSEAQSGQSNGIVAKVGIVNNDLQALALLNPFEMLQFLLVNETGFPVQLPQKAPNLLSNKKGWTFDSAFPITTFSRNQQALDVGELNHETLRLEAHDTLEAQFVVDRVMDRGKEAELPAGIYGVSCIATLINADNRKESRVLESPTIRVRFSR